MHYAEWRNPIWVIATHVEQQVGRRVRRPVGLAGPPRTADANIGSERWVATVKAYPYPARYQRGRTLRAAGRCARTGRAMKKRFALLTLCAAFAVTACGSSHKAKPPGTDVNFKPEFTSVGFSAFSDELAKKTNDLPALEQLSSDTATLGAIEDTAFADADNQDVPRFTADCVQLKPLGDRWNADLANISKNFPGVLAPGALDPTDAKTTLAELLAGCAPFMGSSSPAPVG